MEQLNVKKLASFIVVIGVSGSGKTTIGMMLAKRLGYEFADADSFHPQANIEKMKHGVPLTDEDRWPWLQAIANWIGRGQEEGHHGVIACSALKRVYRDALVAKQKEPVQIVFLEGSRDLIAARIAQRRGHFMPASLLDSQFATLENPKDEDNVVTVSVEGTPKEIVEEIVFKIQG